MSLKFEPCTKENQAELFRLWADVWARGQAYAPEDQCLEPGEQAFLAIEDGRCAGAWMEYAVDLTRGFDTLKGIGVAGVAVPGEYRHAGVGKAMMREALKRMRERGIAVATLYGFRESYYRQFGYEVCGLRYRITCPHECMPRLQPDLPIRRINPDDLSPIKPCYETFARNHSGMWLRTDHYWKRRLGKSPPMIYAAGDPVEAYCWTSMEGSFWDELRFGEVVWSTPRGYHSILALMEGLAINRGSIVWNEPTRSPFVAEFMQEKTLVATERLIMYRAVDVPQSVRSLSPVSADVSGSFSIEVDDVLLPENRGPWRITYGNGKVQVEKQSEPADIGMSIKRFSQLLMGEPNAHTLADCGLMRLGRAEVLDQALMVFSPKTVACWDFF